MRLRDCKTLRDRRVQLVLSQTAVARRAGISQATYCRYERGEYAVPMAIWKDLMGALRIMQCGPFRRLLDGTRPETWQDMPLFQCAAGIQGETVQLQTSANGSEASA